MIHLTIHDPPHHPSHHPSKTSCNAPWHVTGPRIDNVDGDEDYITNLSISDVDLMKRYWKCITFMSIPVIFDAFFCC